jgi:hypothetical protein
MIKSVGFVGLISVMLGIVLANAFGCLLHTCGETNDFVAQTISAFAGPLFPFITSPVVTGYSTQISYSLITIALVLALSFFIGRLSWKAGVAIGVWAWMIVGVFSLSLVRV